jgi:hypothetical protein
MQLAERVHALAQQQNEPALMIGACTALAITHYYSGNFGTGGQYTKRGIQIWRSGGAQAPIEEVDLPAVACLSHDALFKWHNGETVSARATIEEAILLEKELNDMHGLAVALNFAAVLARLERKPAEVERLASKLIELSTRQNFAHWLAVAFIYRGWARCALGNTTEGISLIEDGMTDFRSPRGVPYFLALKAEALHLANRTPEAVLAIKEAEALAENYEERSVLAELYRLRGVFLAAMGADETQIEAPFQEAIRIAKEQKSVSLAKRAEAVV